MDEETPFSRLRREGLRASRETRAANEEAQFEHERVRNLLDRLKLNRHGKAIARAWSEATGEQGRLCFETFNDYFPTFPFVMAASRLRGVDVPWRPGKTGEDYLVHRDPHSVEPERFKNYAWVPFVAQYRRWYERASPAANGRAVCLVFPRKGFRNGMAIHDDASELYWHAGLCQVYKFPGGARKLYAMPYDALVEALYDGGRGWRPPGESDAAPAVI